MFAIRRRTGRVARKVGQFGIPAPLKGLLRTGLPTQPDPAMAEILENFFPLPDGARMRGGVLKYATLDDAVRAFVPFNTGATAELFGATDAAIYPLTTVADATVTPTPAVTGLRSGEWSHVQMATAGGEFLLLVNGTDNLLAYDGADWQPRAADPVNDLPYTGLVGEWTAGTTVTGGTSGATATILAVIPSSATAGTLKLGPITGTFGAAEALSATGATATADGATSVASSLVITGVNTDQIAFIWQHKTRLWLVEEDTVKAWYLPIQSIAGAATAFPLYGVFRKGGKLLFGCTISADAGAGVDDLQCFVSSKGELAIYQGTDPSSAATWALVGLFQIGEPLHKNAHIRVGGDVFVATEEGIVSLLSAMNLDRGALKAQALTAPIEAIWSDAMLRRTGADIFPMAVWPERSLLFLTIPDENSEPQVLVAHTTTRAWATISGWDAAAWVSHADGIYLGTPAGVVYQGDEGGSDDGTEYTARYSSKFLDLGTAGEKLGVDVQVLWQGSEGSRPAVGLFVDYTRGDMLMGGAVGEPEVAVWGSFVWGEGIWSTGTRSREGYRQWFDVQAGGTALAPTVSLTCNQTAAPDFTLVGCVLRYEVGAAR